jgi:hypothetical protein
MELKLERRGGFRGGSKPGNYSWATPGIIYTHQEQEVRHKYLDYFKARIDSYRQVISEPGCSFLGDDSSYETMLYAVKSAARSSSMRTYAPKYPVRYQEYLKGNNAVS